MWENKNGENMNIQRLRDLREDSDISQQKVAEILNTTQAQYNRYESGKRYLPIYHYEKLALFYNTSVDYLIGLTNEKNPYPRGKLKK